MKKLLLFFAMCASLGAWAQDPITYGSGDNVITLNAEGSTLTITGKGQIGGITAPVTTTYFSSSAIGNVYTSDEGAAVSTTMVYDPSAAYYKASRDYTQVFDGGMPTTTGNYVNNINTTKSWIESKLNVDNVYLYPVSDGGTKLGWTTNSGYIYPVEQNVKTTGTWIDAKVNGKYIYKIMNDNNSVKIIDGQITGPTYENLESVKFNDQDYIPYVVSDFPLTGWSNHALDNLEEEGIVILTKSNVSEYADLTTEIKVKGESVVGQTMESWQKDQLAKMNGAYGENYAYIISNSTHSIDDLIDITSDDFTFITASNLGSYIKNIRNLSINGDRITAGNINGALATFDYDSKKLVYYVITSEPKSQGTLIAVGDPSMTVFTVDELNEYINSTTTYTCATDDLYVSKDGGESKTQLANNTSYTYEDGDLFYVAGDAVYSQIEDNAAYFAENSSYLYNDVQYHNVWPTIKNYIDASNYTEVIFVSEGEGLAVIDLNVTHNLMESTKIVSLDYSGVGISTLECPYIYVGSNPACNPEGTFVCGSNLPHNSAQNYTLKKLVLPYLMNPTKMVGETAHYHVSRQLVDHFRALKEITTPKNATCLEKECFMSGSEGFILNKITLNEGLERIGDNAFTGTAPTLEKNIPNYITTLTIPSTVKYIGKTVFNQGTIRDIYFAGKQAPIVELDAFGSKAYVNNNAYTRVSAATNWRGNRENYINGGYLAAMLHMPTNLKDYEKAAYTDITRDYHVFPLDAYEMEDGTRKKDADENVIVYNIVPESKYKSDKVEEDIMFSPTDGYSRNFYWNGKNSDVTGTIAPIGGFTTQAIDKNMGFTGWATDGDGEWANNSAFYDTYVGENYSWPCQYDMVRSYAVATHGLIWDAVTTIGQGIVAAGGTNATVSYDSDCDGEDDVTFSDGSQYIGLHQFLFTTYDVAPETTPEEWKFETIEGENWYSFCVPVSMTVAEVRKAFGAKTQVCKFDHVTRAKGDKVQFYFTDEQCYLIENENAIAVEENVPYMIRPAQYDGADVEATFSLPNYKPASTQVPVAVTKSAEDAVAGKTYKYTFVGQYNTQQDGSYLLMPQYSYFLGNAGKKVVEGKEIEYHRLFFQTGTTGKWKPFTCVIIPEVGVDDYVDFYGGGTVDGQSKVFSGFGLDAEDVEMEATAIENYEIICGSDKASPVYNLNGQMVAKSMNGLQKGIYISNGKKFIIK